MDKPKNPTEDAAEAVPRPNHVWGRLPSTHGRKINPKPPVSWGPVSFICQQRVASRSACGAAQSALESTQPLHPDVLRKTTGNTQLTLQSQAGSLGTRGVVSLHHQANRSLPGTGNKRLIFSHKGGNSSDCGSSLSPFSESSDVECTLGIFTVTSS